MASIDHVVRVSLVLVLSSLSASFRIRRSGIAGYDDPYGLTNAFSDMDRSQRTDFRQMSPKVLDNDDSYFNPNSMPVEYIRKLPYEKDDDVGYIPEYMFEKSFQSYAPVDEYPIPMSGYYDKEFEPQKRTAYVAHRSVPTIDELESLFGEADVPMKRLPPVKRQEPFQRHDDIDTKEDEDDTKANTVRKLIVAAEKLTVNGKPVEQKLSEEIVKPKEGEEGKLEDILKEAVVDENGKVHEYETKEDIDDDEGDENDAFDGMGDIFNDIDETPAQSKSKRASNNALSLEYVQELLQEIALLKQKVSKLELLQMLEGKENDYLANALKFATLDQIDSKNAFIEEEYNDITKATEAESLIQKLEEGADSVTLNDEEEEAEEALLDEIEQAQEIQQQEPDLSEVKRSGDDSDTSGEWLDAPVPDRRDLQTLMREEEPPRDIDETPDDIPVFDDVFEAEPDEVEEEAEEEAEAIEAELEKEDEERHILAQLLGKLSPSTVESIVADLQAKARAQQLEVCAPVLDLSKHCAFADAAGINIDDDARDLCIRHQICYTCGSGIGIDRSGCDDGYKGTVVAECEGDSTCLNNAGSFLKLMERFHEYVQYSPRECQNPCVEDFIYGVA